MPLNMEFFLLAIDSNIILKDQSREFFREWASNMHIEDFVLPATSEAIKHL